MIGTVQFSLEALKKLIELEANVVGVCSREVSSFNSDFADLKPICNSNNILHMYVSDINSTSTLAWIKGLDPDVIFCFGWSTLIRQDLLHLAPMGVVGFHPAGLPKNRGRHPLIWALVLGLDKTASTFFFMDEGADSGDILSQETLYILYQDDARSMYNKMVDLALSQIECFLPQLENRSYVRIEQDHSLANTWRKRGVDDGKIDFRMSSYAIYNLVRGLTKPYVGAHLVYRHQNVIVWKVEEVGVLSDYIEPGKVLESGDGIIVVKCYQKAVKILGHEFQSLPMVGEYL